MAKASRGAACCARGDLSLKTLIHAHDTLAGAASGAPTSFYQLIDFAYVAEVEPQQLKGKNSMIPLTQNDIIFAIIGAALIFVVLKFLITIARILITSSSEIQFAPDQLGEMLENCYRTFPIEKLDFNGETYRRGTTLRITTNRNRTIEGQLVGTNQSEMLCLVTDHSVIAQEIGAIQEIKPMQQP